VEGIADVWSDDLRDAHPFHSSNIHEKTPLRGLGGQFKD